MSPARVRHYALLMAVAIFPLVVFIVGLLIYALLTNPNLVEVGRIAVFFGLLGLTLAYSGSMVRIGSSEQAHR